MTSQVYDALPPPKSNNHPFRLLDILPATSKDDPVKARLRTVRIEDNLDYECLSYCWGAAPEECVITILPPDDEEGHDEGQEDGTPFKLRESLHDALIALRNPSTPRTIWVDAVCINQSDDAERSSQVASMGSIYWKATGVAIWLGRDPDGHAAPAFAALAPLSRDFWAGKFKLTRADVDALDPAPWRGVAALYANPWFRRAWVQQELGLAKSASFYWGEAGPFGVHDLFGFDIGTDFHDGGDRVKELYIEDATAVKVARSLWLHYGQATRPAWMSGAKFHAFIRDTPLLVLLSSAMPCIATDDRDRVYAFLGHPSARKKEAYGTVESEDYMTTCGGGAANPPLVKPDYTRSVDDVFHETARALLQQHADLRPLGAVCHTAESLESASMPSWVPRWGNASPHFRPIGTWTSQWKDKAKAKAAGFGPMRVGWRELLVDGLVVGTVAECLDWTPQLVRRTARDFKARGGWSKEGNRAQRIVCATECGMECLVPDVTRPGDLVAILIGGFSPFVLRRAGDKFAFRLVGACIVRGWVDETPSSVAEKRRGEITQMVLV